MATRQEKGTANGYSCEMSNKDEAISDICEKGLDNKREKGLDNKWEKDDPITNEQLCNLKTGTKRNNGVVSARRWVVLVTSCLSIALASGFTFNMSVLFVELLAVFRGSFAETSLISSVSGGTFLMSGSVIGVILSKYSPRQVGICGALLSSVGIGASFFAPSLGFLVVTLGFISGFGFSSVYMATNISVAEHFDGKAKLLAQTTLSYASGIGTLIMTPLMSYLIGKYGWRGYFLIMAGLCLNTVPCIALCSRRVRYNVTGDVDKKTFCENLKYLRKNTVCIFVLLGFSVSVPFFNTMILQGIDILEYKGFTREEAVIQFFIMDIVSLVFRIIPSLLKFIPHISIIVMPVIYCLSGSVVFVYFPHCFGYYNTLALMCAFGFSRGGIYCTFPIIISKVVRNEAFSTALGFMQSFLGIVSIALGPCLGYLRDVTGSYDIPLYTSGGAQGLACSFFLVALCIRKLQ